MTGGRKPPLYHLLIPTAACVQKPETARQKLKMGESSSKGFAQRTPQTEWEVSANAAPTATTGFTTRLLCSQPSGTHNIPHYTACFLQPFDLFSTLNETLNIIANGVHRL